MFTNYFLGQWLILELVSLPLTGLFPIIKQYCTIYIQLYTDSTNNNQLKDIHVVKQLLMIQITISMLHKN